MTGKAGDHESTGVTPKLPKRHRVRHYNARVRIDSSAPTRIDLAGGTFDIWPLYLFHEGAQTINAAISLRAHCRLTSRRDHAIKLVSEDTGEQVEAADPDDLGVDRLPLVARLVRRLRRARASTSTRDPTRRSARASPARRR